MSTATTTKNLGLVKVTGLIALIAGIIFVIAGGVTWGMVSGQLTDQKITVADDAQWFAGDAVWGPFTAYSQADIINTHALDSTEGRTYAELGALIQAAPEGSDEAVALQAQRTTVMNASFLRASLYTSVVAFGVAALVMGLGVLLGLIGVALTRLAKSAEAPVSPAADREHASA